MRRLTQESESQGLNASSMARSRIVIASTAVPNCSSGAGVRTSTETTVPIVEIVAS